MCTNRAYFKEFLDSMMPSLSPPSPLGGPGITPEIFLKFQMHLGEFLGDFGDEISASIYKPGLLPSKVCSSDPSLRITARIGNAESVSLDHL
jgi:hypothetical protein